MPIKQENEFAYVRRQLRNGARSALPSKYTLGDTLDGHPGIKLRWMEYDSSETSLTKRVGMPVGLLASAPTKVTGDFSASSQIDYQGILMAVPTATNKYVLVASPESDLDVLAEALGAAVTIVTDGFAQAGDQLAWAGDDLFRVNTFGTEGDFCHFYVTHTTAFYRGRICNKPWSKPSIDKAFVAHINNHSMLTAAEMTVGGDASTVSVNASSKGGKNLVTGATANNQVTLYSAAHFTPTSGKRIMARMKVTITEGNTNDAAAFLGFSSVADGVDIMADTTGALGAAAAVGWAAGFYKIKDQLYWRGVKCNASAIVNDTDANIGAMASATEYDLRITIITDSTNTVAHLSLNGATAVTRSQAVGSPSAMRMTVSLKNIPGTSTEAIRIRDLKFGQDV